MSLLLTFLDFSGVLKIVFTLVLGSYVHQIKIANQYPASEMTYIVSGGALNSTHSLRRPITSLVACVLE